MSQERLAESNDSPVSSAGLEMLDHWLSPLSHPGVIENAGVGVRVPKYSQRPSFALQFGNRELQAHLMPNIRTLDPDLVPAANDRSARLAVLDPQGSRKKFVSIPGFGAIAIEAGRKVVLMLCREFVEQRRPFTENGVGVDKDDVFIRVIVKRSADAGAFVI
jgi:hypothetical protein